MLSDKICPYPGLRPFSEEESIFFKGREEHIEKIISQLEEKKFVMLTGASGDGKSSLVYAGVIPNAKAGFFKAKFNNWLIADFRPERTPLKNLAAVITEKLGYFDAEHVERELGSGFSSLVKLYKNSPLYLDQNSDTWKHADEKGQKLLKRKAANLFILVDQFEEFFTNIENFNDGKTSLQSQAVVNLLLETAKIALEEDLPVYIICTMRSDYIGQCASFRGLPEYIGFSQFFVPRLKRKELVQVIEEPALLSGNKINKRLTEVLINELNDGIDQLPILQHTLNRTWKMAMEEGIEMDLIHFAKLGGMEPARLPKEDRVKFASWFTTLPDFKKGYFKTPSLSNVLDAHANELFETANENCGISISKEDAKLIITTSFKCLTKIDENRAVRNRMTLEEIKNVIDQKNISSEKVNVVLNLFREQGNTFIRPFIDDDPESRKLENNTVLDITHESLIRNWILLLEWTKQEEANLLNFKDFKKQVERWTNKREPYITLASNGWFSKIWYRRKGNRKSKTFLLSKGPLAFFEDWYKKAEINASWVMKYDISDVPVLEKKRNADSEIDQCVQFLKRSRSVFRRKRQRKIVSISFGILWAVFWFTFIYFQEKRRAEEMEGIIANTSIIGSAEKMNVLYIGVDNPMTFVFPGVDCEDVVPEIQAGKGKLIPTKECGRYIVHVEPDSSQTISFTAKININGEMKKLINPISFRVKRVPDPVAALQGAGVVYSGEKITKEQLLKENSIIETIRNFDFDIKMKIVSFNFSAMVNGKVVEYSNKNGNQITDQMKKAIEYLKPGGRVYFEDINVKMPDGSIRKLQSMLIEIH